MRAELRRYLVWWLHENRWDRLIFVVPLLLGASVLGLLMSLKDGDLLQLGIMIGVGLLALLFFSLDYLTMWRKRPWNREI